MALAEIIALFSLGMNIWQYLENSTLREKIEQLEAIIRHLHKVIDEQEKRLKALSRWHWIERRKIRNRIDSLEKIMIRISKVKNNENSDEIDKLLRELYPE